MNPMISMLIGIVSMMLLIRTRLHPFPVMVLSALLIAILSGDYLLVNVAGDSLLSVAIQVVSEGFGSTMASIGIVIGLGCIMGSFLEKSGAAKCMALCLLRLVGIKKADIVLGITGLIVSIPVFCDSGFVILSTLAKEFSRLTKKSMVLMGGLLGMGLLLTHQLVPPTPGPLAVVSTFQENGINIDLGLYIVVGLLFSIPLFIFAIFLFRWMGKKYPQFIIAHEIDKTKYSKEQLIVLDRIHEKNQKGEELTCADFVELIKAEKLPSASLSFSIILLPILLILLNTIVAQTAFSETWMGQMIEFMGHPIIALFLAVCMGTFALCRTVDKGSVVKIMNDALMDAGPIVMITAAGGALGAVVKVTGAATMLANSIISIGIPGILVPLFIGASMRFPQGSATTAMVTGSAILAPMMSALDINPYLGALGLCVSAMFPSFLNDSYFHVVCNFSGLDVKTCLKTWTISTMLVPVVGGLLLFLLNLIIPI